VYRKETKVHVH